ncbi:MAG: HD-GYP domain-containing protein, partial [Terriglobales bacterium]
GHGEAVARHAETIGKELMLAPDDLADLLYAARVHDVGKIVIPEQILNKPEVLNEEEYTTAQMHAAVGSQLVQTIPDSDRIRRCVRHHHERFDGKGYPDGLTGEQIPLGARILAVADAYVHMTTDRPYAAVKSPADAMRELEANSGTQFDGMLVRIFVHQLKDEGVTRRGN